ncbi:AMP-binding protein [Modestobacter versicolor]|uniref:AMP-binding protein n=1 Tax=Modestobacter versicolor TaxID=429133 RepID=UPI0034DEE654
MRVVDRVVDVGTSQPETLAIADGRRSVTYGQLLAGADVVRRAVLDVRVADAAVAVLRSPGAGAAVAVIGVMATGSPVLVLDPTTPAERLRHYVSGAGVSVCVADAAHADVAAELCASVVVPDDDVAAPADLAAVGVALRSAPTGPDDPAVVVFTSGSTGRPKGVLTGSRTLLHDAWTNSVGTGLYGAGDVVGNLMPLAFDAGMKAVLAGMLAGATQQLFDPRTRPVSELAGWLREQQVTVLLASPAILRGLVSALRPGEHLDTLTAVTMGGEMVHGSELAAFRRVVGPQCVLRNRYGSTETGLLSDFVLRPEDPSPTGATPAGWPVPGVRFQVQDADGVRADSGTGRLVVSSRWLAEGYLGQPEVTASVFSDGADGVRTYLTSDTASIDDDGLTRLLGRTDHSVKVRGHLVEPGEVDAVLFAHPEVREAVVVGAPDPATGRIRLVAYVVPAVPRLDASTVRRVVRDALPPFMVPQEVLFLPALPRTERGKLDRSALPPPPPRATARPPRTDWERVVAALFARVLETDEVGLDDDFFSLGGDSLAAEALLAAVGDELGVSGDVLSTGLLVEAPTVARFADAVRQARRPEHPTLVRLASGGSRVPLFCVAGAGGVALGFRALARELGDDQPVWGLQAHGLENRGLPDWSVRATARRHVATLRTVQPAGPYRLAGHSLGAVIALEMAHLLRSEGEEVELLAVLDSFPPDPALSPPALTGGPYQRVKGAVALATTGLLPDSGLGHYLRFHRQGMALQRRHRTSPYPGRTLVLVARDDPDSAVRALWAPHLTGQWSMHEVPGDHVGMLHEPNVTEVAQLLAAELDALDGARPDPVEALRD